MGSIARYRRFLDAPHMAVLVVLAQIARLPIGIVMLALVLFVREQTGSFATAGAVAAAFTLAAGLFAPVQGRAVDRLGQTKLLVPLALVNAGAVVALIALGVADAPLVTVFASAVVAGAAVPPISACFRSVMMEELAPDEELLRAGYALDSIAVESIFILGPLITALLAAIASPAAALAAGAAIGLGGTLAFAAQPASRAWPPSGVAASRAGALASPGLRTLAFTALPIGICFGTLEVTLPAFGAEHGNAGLGGVLFAVLSLGSIAGGLVYGAAGERLGTVVRGYLVLVAALPACFALLVLPGSLALMIALVPLAGCVIAPLTAAESQLASALTPRGTETEAYTWLIMATVVGASAGNAAAGAIVDASGWRAALLVACGAAALGALLNIARRRTLQPLVPAGAERG